MIEVYAEVSNLHKYKCLNPEKNLNSDFLSKSKYLKITLIFLIDFKKKSKIGPIKTVDVYPLLCDLLQIKCNPNNGSITPFLEARSFAENESKFCYFIQITLFALLYFI